MSFRSTALLRTARIAIRPAPAAPRFISSTIVRRSALGYGDPVEEGVTNNSGTTTPPQSKNPGESASTDPEVSKKGASEGKDGQTPVPAMDTPEKDKSGVTGGTPAPEEYQGGKGEMYDKQTESVMDKADSTDRHTKASKPEERKKVGEAPKKQ